jgi:hypothetical protein
MNLIGCSQGSGFFLGFRNYSPYHTALYHRSSVFRKTKYCVTWLPIWSDVNIVYEYVQDIRKNQYSIANVVHFLFNLLRINGLYMFRALLAYPQEALHKRHLVYCVRVISVGCTTVKAELVSQTPFLNKLNRKCITLVLLYWCTMMHCQQNIQYVREKLVWTGMVKKLRARWNPTVARSPAPDYGWFMPS